MPPKRRSSITPGDDYESDGGFIEDAPKSKKAKTSKTPKNKRENNPSEGEAATGGGEVGKDGEVFWELSGKRRISLQEFKGNTMVNIREYYEKEGEMLPGKKGISLPVEQYNTLIQLIPHIEKVLTDKGEKIGRPDFNGAEASAVDVDDEQEPGGKAKKNFEETSDEE